MVILTFFRFLFFSVEPRNHQSFLLANYMSSYPVPYNSVPAVAPTPADYTYQPPVHMVPTYYPPPGQQPMQPPPVMYRVPTPPNTPISNQVKKKIYIYIYFPLPSPPRYIHD